ESGGPGGPVRRLPLDSRFRGNDIEGAERGGPRSGPGVAEPCVQGVKVQVQIGSKGADERSVATPAAATRQAREGGEEAGQLLAGGRPAEDVQAVADLQFLEFAEMIVELAEGRLGVVASADAAILVEPSRRRQLEDALAQQPAPARIQAGGLVVFV